MRISAFSLIELLTVIAIIAILAALLFPVFAAAKVSAKGAAAMEYLRQNYSAIQLYQGESSGLPRGISDSTFLQLEKTGEHYGAPIDDKLPRVRVADLLLPFVKDARIFRSPRAPKFPRLDARFGKNYFGWGWNEQRAVFGDGPNFDPAKATLMREFVDYESPLSGDGRTACLFDSGSVRMTGRMECLAGFRDLAVE